MERIAHGCETRRDSTTQITIARVLTWCTPECASFVRLKQPRMVAEATTCIQEYEWVQ